MDPAFSLIVRCSLALLLATAAAHKLRDPREFHGIVLDYRLLPPRLAVRVARLLPWVELMLAVAVLAGWPAGLACAALVFVAYAAAMGVNLARGRAAIDCGCGGAPQPLSVWLLVRNAVLAAMALLAALPAAERSLGGTDIFTVIAGTAAAAALYVAAHELHAARARFRTLFATHA